MDNLSDAFLNTIHTDDDAGEGAHTDADADAQNISSPEQSSKKPRAKAGRWRSLSAFSTSATMQDKLLDKSVFPPHPTG